MSDLPGSQGSDGVVDLEASNCAKPQPNSLRHHPLADLFPMMQGAEFERFRTAVKSDGRLHDEIVLLDGMILDGRNRQRACDETGVAPRYRYFAGEDGDPLRFVIAKNLSRRHLDESQRAMVAAKVETFTHGGNRKSEDQDANLHVDRRAAAELTNVSPRSVAAAAKVRKQGDAELATRPGGSSRAVGTAA